MAEVALNIGGRSYTIACRDGGEAHLQTLAAIVEQKIVEARSAVGDVNETRQMLLAALLLADELAEAQSVPVGVINAATAQSLERIADRVEAMAKALEEATSSA